MNVHFPAPRRGWPTRLVNLAVVVVVLALAAATFVLSYTGMHAIALQAGVSVRLARLYPGVFDAVLVIACVAAVTLRYARWWARSYAWLVIIVVVAVVGAADAVHAMNVTLPRRETEGVVAAAPWVLVLLGFSLMLTVLRQSRAQHSPAATVPARDPVPAPQAPEAPQAPQAPQALEVPQAPQALEVPQAPEAPAQADQTAPYGPLPSGEDHPPTLEVPALAERQASPVAAAELDDPRDHATEQEAAATADVPEAQAESFQYLSAPGWLERVADSGDPGPQPHDYWESDDHGGLEDKRHQPAGSDEDAPSFRASPPSTVPRLNRVRATPIPPEEDDEEE